jgi:hypothetical protein
MSIDLMFWEKAKQSSIRGTGMSIAVPKVCP